jgi:hypothetical protein
MVRIVMEWQFSFRGTVQIACVMQLRSKEGHPERRKRMRRSRCPTP